MKCVRCLLCRGGVGVGRWELLFWVRSVVRKIEVRGSRLDCVGVGSELLGFWDYGGLGFRVWAGRAK